MMVAAYEMLRASPPFNRWKLTHSDEVEFHVTLHSDRSGDCSAPGGQHIIRISAKYHPTFAALFETMAHEMIHMRQHMQGQRGTHGKRFKRLALQVCRHHGFNIATF